jgi:hypothetical protein
VAYRQLCAVTFAALGLVFAGCGGNTASSASSGSDPGEVQPPNNTDQPPHSAGDQAPSSSETPPSNPDRPPSSADDPAGSGGGGVGDVCRRLCDAVAGAGDRCGKGMNDLGLGNVCSEEIDCQVPPNFPCGNQAVNLFNCLFNNLSLLCADDGDGNNGEGNGEGPTSTACQSALQDFIQCGEDNGLDDDGDDNDPDPPACSRDGGCDCPTECQSCTCDAGTDVDELAECAAVCS